MSSDNPARIKAIETRYAGCRFRSRTEARWAVFFDTLGIAWEYEPQGFLIGQSEVPYLPDFWLPGPSQWVEVKGAAGDLNQGLIEEFAIQLNASLLVLGPIPGPGSWSWSQIMGWPADPHVEGSADAAHLYRVSFTGRSHGHVLQMETLPDTSSSMWTIDGSAAEWLQALPVAPNREQHAYVAARSARFEHGERG